MSSRELRPPTVESTCNSAYNVEHPSLVDTSDWKPSELSSLPPPPPGFLAGPPTFISQPFYETVRDTQSLFPSQTSSSGVTRGTDSCPGTRDVSSPPLTPMSAPRDSRGADSPHSFLAPSPTEDSHVSGHRPARQMTSHRSFQRQSFPSPSFYPPRSTPLSEPLYPVYPQHPSSGPGYIGQYTSNQPPHSMAIQSFAYSQPFAHPGVHAPDPSAMGIPFGTVPPPISRGFSYQHLHGSDGLTGESRDVRSGQDHPPAEPPPFAPSSSASHAAPVPTTTGSGQHVSHHTYNPLHFSPSPSGPHYRGYPVHSFAHSSPGLYSYPPNAYQQAYYSQLPASPDDSSKAGTWWYVASGPVGGQQYESSPYRGGFYQPSMQMNHPEYDPYPPPGPGSPSNAFPGLSGRVQQPQQPTMHLPPHEPTFPPSSPITPPPGPSTSGAGAGAVAPSPPPFTIPARSLPPSPTAFRGDTPGSSSSSPSASRKPYHPNPPSNRSQWVMWVGNVPSDATHDELWNFFNQSAPIRPLPLGMSTVMSSRHVHPPPVTKDKKDMGEVDAWGGVSSVFVITRSNCAFVNFDTEAHLTCALTHFNGKPLRPKDSRCPRLVCRMRRRGDDLKAGVGGQRGMGMHTRWVIDQKERERELGREWERELKARDEVQIHDGKAADGEQDSIDAPPTSPSTYLAASRSSDPSPPTHAISSFEDLFPVPGSPSRASPDDKDPPRQGSSGDRSFASTNSSFLATNFPKRYFILKSLTEYDLNLSLERGVWATQPHNEGILDQAYRTSLDVYLIFGVNKSGEFFGYARMSGPVFHNDRVDHVSWASRQSAPLSAGNRGSSPPEVIAEEDESDKSFLSPSENRMVGESPAPVTPSQEARLRLQTSTAPDTVKSEGHASAPAEPHQPHRRISRPQLPREAETYPEPPRKAGETLDLSRAISDRPQFALRFPPSHREGAATRPAMVGNASKSMLQRDVDGVLRVDTYSSSSESQHLHDSKVISGTLGVLASESYKEHEDPRVSLEDKPDGWGREFKIEWLRTKRLSFNRTRHLRNPWNHDREVKVSRDGTELEPSVGQRLIDEWDISASHSEASPSTSPKPIGGRVSRTHARVGDNASAA